MKARASLIFSACLGVWWKLESDIPDLSLSLVSRKFLDLALGWDSLPYLEWIGIFTGSGFFVLLYHIVEHLFRLIWLINARAWSLFFLFWLFLFMLMILILWLLWIIGLLILYMPCTIVMILVWVIFWFLDFLIWLWKSLLREFFGLWVVRLVLSNFGGLGSKASHGKRNFLF